MKLFALSSILELSLLIIWLSRHIKKNCSHSPFILLLIIIAFVLDFIFVAIKRHNFFTSYNTIELITVAAGIRFFKSLLPYKLQYILVIQCVFLIIDILLAYYQINGWYNIHFVNTYYLIAGILFNIFFFYALDVKGQTAHIYKILSVFFIAILLIEFLSNDQPRVMNNVISTTLIHLQNIALSGILISRIISSSSTTRLEHEPYFWLFIGLILHGVVIIVCDSAHAYMTANMDIIHQFPFIVEAPDYSRYVFDICCFVAIIQSRRQYLTSTV